MSALLPTIAGLLLVADSALQIARVVEARVPTSDAESPPAPWYGGTVRGQGYLANAAGALCGAAVGFFVGAVAGLGPCAAGVVALYEESPSAPPDDELAPIIACVFFGLFCAFVLGIAGCALGCATAVRRWGRADAWRTAATALKALALTLLAVGVALSALDANDTTHPFMEAIFDHDIVKQVVGYVGVPAVIVVPALVARRLALRTP